ncbi:ATP-binding protein [Pseudoflavonifractor hominis]|uniref:ATP-binding protein n=1 Tax=Pseudoflavonifractor hominis TaxID=2763059 RepID=A0ABR7HSM3_9FIRM|nr:ATP-binding protein [Pseudoflavonifractor hominis]MBC5730497.1 ATP-binding protein [Pseudoflavonifractor hominis]
MAYKSVNVEITQEHFDRSIKGSPKEAVKELIWNACDADAKNIEVSFDYDGIAGAESVSDIYVKDDGHGIAIDRIEEYFGKYGRSQKTYSDKSPGGRIYHGKLGQGRYKSLAAGNFLDWDSVFRDESGTLLRCEIHINSASRMNISYSETAEKAESEHTGTIVHIHGIPDEKIGFITKMAEPMETIPDLLATFAPYLLAYTDITIKYNGVTVDPAQQIKSQEDQELVYEEDGKEPIKARLSAITWKEAQFNKLYICGSSGVVYAEMDYTPLKRTSTSLYLMGDLFEQMHRDNTLAMGNTNPAYAYFEEEAKKFARALVGEQEEEDAAVEIARIKEEGIYPYDGEPEDDMKKAERDVFDVFAVQVNRAVPQLKSSSRQTKKLTYRLMREAINTNPASIKTILTEVFNLTQQQQDDLAELLTHTSLPDIIDTAKTVSDRLVFLQVLEEMVYNDSVGKAIKERTQFHKVLLKELWIFGEKYTLGTSDQSLRNLLKAHLNCLGRDELTPEIPPEAVEDLTRIPDLCLFQQICPSYENFEHLVIELKRPTLTLTLKEMDQIRDYALTVAENPMFDKTRTKWHFVLLGQRLDQHVQRALRNQTVGEGNFYNADNVSISVFEWSKIIQDNKLKYEYLRRKLNHQLSSDPNFASDYLRTKHAELFPTEE